MRKEVFGRVHLLCDLFPGLNAPVRFSEVLSEQELTVFGDFTCLNTTIKLSDMQHVEKLLTAAVSRDTGLLVGFNEQVYSIRNNKNVWQTLQKAYEKIIAHELTGTYPLPSLKLSEKFLLKNSQKFHHQLHQVIHHVLEQNDIFFDDEQLDEGLVVFLHSQMANKAFYYADHNGKKCDEYANCFEELCRHFDRERFVQMLKEISSDQLKNLLKPFSA
ncbi:hypothetical protein COV18_01135 [Candidatus Woesearchaeota archaeon CG10_big_fil_rev_8_21_14_0_10_37_12]|nr:MAG: hypothetical protein COV18_01135 [Candidatus Woesearchaeota archaeon CG10_big_fil_rev_8_21_14_0_10_37_12]